MKYELVIFDFDGTLADSFPWAASVVNQYADTYGFKRIEPHEHDTLRNYDARNLMQHLGVRMWKVPQMASRCAQAHGAGNRQIPLFPGIDGMLRALVNAGAMLAVVSSNSEANVRHVLGPQNTALFQPFRLRRVGLWQNSQAQVCGQEMRSEAGRSNPDWG